MHDVSFSSRERRLLRYALGYLEVSLDPDLVVEAAQETAPETQEPGDPLPDVRAMTLQLKAKFVGGLG